jgi:hypothetical protein
MSKRKGPTKRRAWTPLQRATPIGVGLREGTFMMKNDRYTVTVKPLSDAGMDGVVHISIRNSARSAVRDWRDFQRIKNEVVGPEREALEVYPRESRLIDTSNQYHLWVLPVGEDIPFGFDVGRSVNDGPLDDDAVNEAAKLLGVDPDVAREHLTKAKQRAL